MHCKADEEVDVSHAHRLAQAAPDATLVTFDGCSHAEIYRDHPGAYYDALISFIEQTWIT
jgi:fermentation-respiration switch protein FrsA (DUF1100 family)